MSSNEVGVSLIKHQSGDLFIYDENSLTGSRGYGPLHHSEVPTNPTEILNILNNQLGSDLEDDGNWLFDEMQAGRAVPMEYKPERNKRNE
jgi:hypothetical protein